MTCNAAHVCVAHSHTAAHTAPTGVVAAVAVLLVVLPVLLFWGAAILDARS